MTIYEARVVLNLQGNYDEGMLKKQYHLMTKKYHPDNCRINGISVELANLKIKQINEANSVLMKELKEVAENGYAYDNYILNELREKLRMNKDAIKECEKLMDIFNAFDIVFLLKTLITELEYNIKNVYNNNDTWVEKVAKYNEYKKEYNDSIIQMYDMFYDKYMKKYCTKNLEDETLYTWILNNRNENRNFSYIGDITRQIKSDLELVIALSNERKKNAFIVDIKAIHESYQNYVFYDKLENKIKNIIESYISKVEVKVNDKKNKRRNLKTVILETKNKTITEINNLFYFYSIFFENRQRRIEDLKNKIMDNGYGDKEEVKKVLLELENEFDQDRFNAKEEYIIHLISKNGLIGKKSFHQHSSINFDTKKYFNNNIDYNYKNCHGAISIR